MKKCNVRECDRDVYAVELCEAHYAAVRRGSAVEQLQGPPRSHRSSGAQPPACSVVDCASPTLARGLCGRHYAASRRPSVVPRVRPECAVDGCYREARSRGWCQHHYTRWKRWGDPADRVFINSLPCSVDDCTSMAVTKGLCQKHYDRTRKETPQRRAKARERYRHNPTVKKAAAKRWQQAHPDRVRIKNENRRAREAAAVGSFSLDDWERLVARHRGCCAYCGERPERLTVEHVIPLTRGGTNWIGNILPACRSCNSSKNDRLLVEWRLTEIQVAA